MKADARSDTGAGPTAWVAEHGDALYRYARARVGPRELAEDLVQETFLAALSALDQFEGRSTSRTWLVAILRRKISDHFRRAGGSSELPETTVGHRAFDESGKWARPPSRWKSPEKALEAEEFRAVLSDCLDHLPPHLAAPFVLRECEGLEADEVRRASKLTAANLRVRLHRARLLLRDCLEAKWFDAPGGERRDGSRTT